MRIGTEQHLLSQTVRRRNRRALLAAGGLTGGLLLAVPAAPAHAAYPDGCVETGPTTVVCTWESGRHTLPLPAGVTSVHVVAVGAKGATTNGTYYPDAGRGARVEGDLPVTPGTTLIAVVGASSGDTAGGSNIGGAPGNGSCGWGGGASDVRTGNLLADRKVVAAGGGGPGCKENGTVGARGGDAGTAGNAGDAAGSGTGGQPGTGTSGGAGGDAGGGITGGGLVGGGANGGFGTGGSGGGVLGAPNAGGGGGGGWYGGGGGGAGTADLMFGTFGYGGGGGGGSSLVPPGWAAPTIASDFGVPRIVISFSTAPLPTIAFTSGEPPAGVVGQEYSHTYTASGDDGISYGVTGGTLPPGLALDPSGEVSGTPTTAGTFTYTVTATGSSGATASREDTISVTEAPPAVADLAVGVKASPNPVRSGDTVNYVVTVTNHGPNDASGLKMDDVLPSGTQFTSLAAPAGWSCTTPPAGSHGTVSCNAESLASGGSAVFTIAAKVVVTSKSTLVNTATVTASSADPNAANDSASTSTSVQGGSPKKS